MGQAITYIFNRHDHPVAISFSDGPRITNSCDDGEISVALNIPEFKTATGIMSLKKLFFIIALCVSLAASGEGTVNIRKAVIENEYLVTFLENKLIPFIKDKGYNVDKDRLYIECYEPQQDKGQNIFLFLYPDENCMFMDNMEEIRKLYCTEICDIPVIIVCKDKPDFIKISKGYIPVHWHEPTFIELLTLDGAEAEWFFNYKDKELTFTGFDNFYIDWFKDTPPEEYIPEKPWRAVPLERNIPASISFDSITYKSEIE